MAYKISWQESTKDDFKRLDRAVAERIIDKATGHLVKDPLALGFPLTGNFRGLYRYRVGDYRLIYVVDMEEKTIKILRIGHRKDVYE